MIESIHLDPQLCRDSGLKEASLVGLGEIVALAGPNGSGKTRLLRLLTEQWRVLGGAAARILALPSLRIPQPLGTIDELVDDFLEGMTNANRG